VDQKEDIMNERIKELAEQSGFYFYDLHDIGGEDLGETIEADSWEAAEKFAELIVRECIEQAELEEDRFTGLDAIDLAHAMQNFQNLLKKHFGIE